MIVDLCILYFIDDDLCSIYAHLPSNVVIFYHRHIITSYINSYYMPMFFIDDVKRMSVATTSCKMVIHQGPF